MRAFWIGVLMTGLLLVSLSVYDRTATTTETGVSTVTTCEDGTGFPKPYPR
jgi:hypothetical protein